jgi:hypothetical protein
MRDLFDRLRGEGYSVIDELVTTRTQETVQLDFKLKDDQTNGDLTKKDRTVLGPALSALANSAGGVLIWGIEAARDADGVDAAKKAVPILNLARFRSDVERAVGELLMPRHEGIEIAVIEDPGAGGSGFLAIWVARSDRRPHRSEAAGDRRYYKRAGDSTYVMEHTDIEDAFNRVAPTELSLTFDGYERGGAYNDATEGRIEECALKFSLRNDDRRSACAPYVWVENVTGGTVRRVITGAGQTSTLNEYAFGTRQTFAGDGTIFIHPGVAVPAFQLVIRFATRQATTLNGRTLDEALIKFSYGYGCENSRMRTGAFKIEGTDIEDFRRTPLRVLREKHQPRNHDAE